MERGEIHGWAASWENLDGTRPPWMTGKEVIRAGAVHPGAQASLSRRCGRWSSWPRRRRDNVEFLGGVNPFGRAIAVGPGVPADRVAVLRKAFDATMKDAAFLADAQKRNVDIDPRNAAYAHTVVNKITSAPPELVARVKRAIGQED